MKKIIVLSSVHPWNDPRVYHKEVLTLLRAGYQVNYYAVEGQTNVLPEHPGLTITLLPKRNLARRYSIWRYFLKEVKQKQPDAVHLHDPELLFLVPRMKKITTAKIIFDMHEDFPAALKSKRLKGIPIPTSWMKYLARYEKKQLAKVDLLLFAEKYYKENYLDISTMKTDILNYPFLNKQLDDEAKYPVPTLIYAGAIHEIRGFKEMLELARILHERGCVFQMFIIGQVPERLTEWSSAYTKLHHLESIVQLKGRLDLESLNQYYKKSHIGLALLHPEPNYLRSLPTKLFEYMSFGLPYVASDFPLWCELMTDSGSGIPVSVLDVSGIADKIAILLNEQEKYRDFVINGRSAHGTHYNWEIEAKKLLQTYQILFRGDTI
ncbi:glycosyltransferase [Listeria ivanovii]|uniref:glycosyltransferase n=1 Tax=Listeria ivanovii TaxID=1638 RepID=UPI00162A8470|nr:glycosyltransferase [Listeria ivanovii]MBC1760849.1 glycosyltransferase family 4 protein [Listeria ivanovii]